MNVVIAGCSGLPCCLLRGREGTYLSFDCSILCRTNHVGGLQESDVQSSVIVLSEQNKVVIEKGSNDNSGVDEKVEQQTTSTSLVIESEKTDENRPTLAS